VPKWELASRANEKRAAILALPFPSTTSSFLVLRERISYPSKILLTFAHRHSSLNWTRVTRDNEPDSYEQILIETFVCRLLAAQTFID
jgi:hypothetical protein